jgi:hypothetical protein
MIIQASYPKFVPTVCQKNGGNATPLQRATQKKPAGSYAPGRFMMFIVRPAGGRATD